MAVIRILTRHAAQHDSLVERLVEELARDARTGQPFVYINNVGQTGSFHVTVVWDAWQDLSAQQRSSIIMDALEQHDPAKRGHITIAMGLTGEEARRLGILRFKIQLMPKKCEESQQGQLKKLLRDEGAFETHEGLQLLFRTEEQANEAYDRLQTAAPGNHWALVREESGQD